MKRNALTFVSCRLRKSSAIQAATPCSVRIPKTHPRGKRGVSGSGPPSVGLVASFAVGAASLAIHRPAASGCEGQRGRSAGPLSCPSLDSLPPNPLWPSGVPAEMVEAFVDEIIADSDVNIAAIPNAIERQIYVSTVRLTLNAVYESVGGLHGYELLGHRLELRRIEKATEQQERAKIKSKGSAAAKQSKSSGSCSGGSVTVDSASLEAVADRLLANVVVNQPLVPDVVERQLYINCLKLVFRLLDAVASTLRITVCGHDLSVRFKPSPDASFGLGDRAQRASSSLTQVNLDAVAAFARQAGATPEESKGQWGLGRILEPRRREFVAQLHATLYALVLAIVDDLLEDTVLTFLTDRIRVDVVPVERKPEKARLATAAKVVSSGDPSANGQAEASAGFGRGGGAAAVPVAFTLGVSAGAILAFAACGR